MIEKEQKQVKEDNRQLQIGQMGCQLVSLHKVFLSS